MPKKNIKLLRRLATRFKRMRHPEHFEMMVVTEKNECGTAMCIAGHTLDLAGYHRRLVPKDQRGEGLDHKFTSPSGDRVSSPLAAAQKELGLTRNEAMGTDGLFYDYSLSTPAEAAARIEQLITEAKG